MSCKTKINCQTYIDFPVFVQLLRIGDLDLDLPLFLKNKHFANYFLKLFSHLGKFRLALYSPVLY